jgi:hypothetical protein
VLFCWKLQHALLKYSHLWLRHNYASHCSKDSQGSEDQSMIWLLYTYTHTHVDTHTHTHWRMHAMHNTHVHSSRALEKNIKHWLIQHIGKGSRIHLHIHAEFEIIGMSHIATNSDGTRDTRRWTVPLKILESDQVTDEFWLLVYD